MAKYEDYVKPTAPEEAKIDAEVVVASQQQEIRATEEPVVDWEKRYADLEVAYSRQGNQLGEYRTMVDSYISTPEISQEVPVEVTPITTEELYDHPAETVNKAIEAHPAIQEVLELKTELANKSAALLQSEFEGRHPGFQQIATSPEFATWVGKDNLRSELAQRASNSDVTAADALFTLYEAESATNAADAAQVEAVNLETGAGAEPPAPDLYSRSEMLEQKIRAKQGFRDSQDYVKANAVAYRLALGEGNVRD